MALAFELSADVTKFDRAMNRAKELVANRTSEMITMVQSASRDMDGALSAIGATGALGPGLRTAANFLITYKAAVLTATAAVAAWGVASAIAADQVEKLGEIAKGIKQADVGAGFFQTWARAAEEANISTKEATDALVKARAAVTTKLDRFGDSETSPITDLLGETAIGRGVAVAEYQRFINAPNTEQRIKAVTDAIRELNREATRTGSTQLNQIGDQLASLTFGDAKFAEPIRAAKDSMDALQATAAATGTIFNDDLVRRSKELDERVKAVNREMSDGMRPIMDDLASLGLNFKESWVDVQTMIAGAVRLAGELYSGIKKIADIVPNLKLSERFAEFAINQGLGDSPETKLARLLKADKKAPGIFSGGEIAARAAGLNPMDVAWPVVSTFNPPAKVPLPKARPSPKDLANGGERLKESTPTSDDIDMVQRYLNQLQRSVEVLEAEAGSLGKTRAERSLAVEMARLEYAVRERGTAATAEEIARTQELAAKKAQLNQVLDDYRQKQQQLNELGGFVGNQLVDAFDSILTQGASVTQVLDNITRALMKAALQAAILGDGPLKGLLGTAPTAGSGSNLGGLIGALLPARASGGPVQAGKAYLVGENGPEMVRFGKNGSVTPNAVMGRAGGTPSVEFHQINQSSAKAGPPEVSRGADGRLIIRQILREELGTDLATNGFVAQILQNRYRLNRTGGKG